MWLSKGKIWTVSSRRPQTTINLNSYLAPIFPLLMMIDTYVHTHTYHILYLSSRIMCSQNNGTGL